MLSLFKLSSLKSHGCWMVVVALWEQMILGPQLCVHIHVYVRAGQYSDIVSISRYYRLDLLLFILDVTLSLVLVLSFPVKSCITVKLCTFLNLPQCSSCSTDNYLKSLCVILLKLQWLTPQYYCNIHIQVFGQKYCDVWFCPYPLSLIHIVLYCSGSLCDPPK